MDDPKSNGVNVEWAQRMRDLRRLMGWSQRNDRRSGYGDENGNLGLATTPGRNISSRQAVPRPKLRSTNRFHSSTSSSATLLSCRMVIF